MSKGTFFTGQPIFNQVLNYIPRTLVHTVSREHHADHYCKTFKTYEHLVTMLYAIFNQCNSLREVTTGLLAWDQRIHHLGIDAHPRRSTISDANKRRSEKVFEAIYFKLLSRYRSILPDSRKRSKKNNLYIFDSTSITLFQEILKGSGLPKANGKSKGGIKVHTLLHAGNDLPEMIRYSPAANNDVTWVTRHNERSVYRIKEKYPVNDYQRKQGIKSDWSIELGYNYLKKAVQVPARIIKYVDPVSKKTFRFITNNTSLAPMTITNYYRQRWQIETFFKRIKQNYPLKYFLGDNENAIKIQIGCALIADLLLKVIKRGTRSTMSFSNIAGLVRLHLMTYMDLKSFLNSPEKSLIRKVKEHRHRLINPSLFEP